MKLIYFAHYSVMSLGDEVSQGILQKKDFINSIILHFEITEQGVMKLILLCLLSSH